jgi:hypothetical protein
MSMQMQPGMQPGMQPFDTKDTAIVATFARYEGAQRAVDALSDAGFDVARSAIVWNGLKRVEYVTGRETVATAALKGAAGGAWFASFFGLLVALFVDTDSFGEILGIVVSYLVIGALVGAAWFAFAHWSTRGKRDFASIGTFEAETYDVRVPTAQRAEAEAVLGVHRGDIAPPTPATPTTSTTTATSASPPSAPSASPPPPPPPPGPQAHRGDPAAGGDDVPPAAPF